MTSTVKAPRTVGPNLAELTIREQAVSAWISQRSEDRRKAERAALNLVQRIFGNVPVAFDDFVPEWFAKKHKYEPKHLVTFALEGLEFNYVAATKDRSEAFYLIDKCPCGRGPRTLARIENLADIGRAHEWDYEDSKCFTCRDDEKKAETK